MKYGEYEENGRFKEVKEKHIDADYVKSRLEYIKRGWIPDYNSCEAFNSDNEKVVVWDEYYEDHVAMMVAIAAIEKLAQGDPNFFIEQDLRFEDK